MSKRKIHPNSLKNLTHIERPYAVGEPKPRQLTVSETGWEGAVAIAEELGCTGVSDLLEKVGRKHLTVVDLKKVEDRFEIYPNHTGSPWAFKFNEVVEILAQARRKLVLPSDGET